MAAVVGWGMGDDGKVVVAGGQSENQWVRCLKVTVMKPVGVGLLPDLLNLGELLDGVRREVEELGRLQTV